MKKLLIASCIVLFLLFAMIFRPVSIPTKNNTVAVTGVVEELREGGRFDLVFRFKDDPTRYYVNRGLETTFNLEDVRSLMLGKEATIKYIKHWTPLDHKGEVKHVGEVIFNGEVLYTEFPEKKGKYQVPN